MALIAPVTIEMLRIRCGFADDDTSHDDAIMANWNVALSIVERFLDRDLEFKAGVEELFSTPTQALNVHRWPIKQTNEIRYSQEQLGPVDSALYWTDGRAGLVHLHWQGGRWHPLTLNYDGGYEELPPDLAWALLAVFDQAWLLDPAGGGSQGGIGIVSGQKFTVTGVGSIDYGGLSGGAMGSASDPWALIPASVRELLDSYSNHARVGVG